VATAALAAPDVSAPIRQLLWRQRNVTVLMGVVQRIEVEKTRILFENRHLDYDYLVVATGMTHAYFGNDKWAAHAPGLKTVAWWLWLTVHLLSLVGFRSESRVPEFRSTHPRAILGV
jgi:NADH dehydrogenase